MYSTVRLLYTPHHYVHLYYPCISVHPLSHVEDIPGGGDPECFEMDLEADIDSTYKCPWTL